MVNKIAYKHVWLIAAACGLVALALSGVIRLHASASGARSIASARAAEGALAQRIASMAGYDDAALIRARDARAGLSQSLMNRQAWTDLLKELGPDWTVEPGEPLAGEFFTIRPAKLHFGGSSLGDWPHILEAVALIEKRPGIGISEMRFQSEGDRVRRRLTEVLLTVELHTSPGAYFF